ncbi:Xaa-Pro peptidase family protein [Acidipila sp. EB88]|uniref:M24 family metallopeptidase n=1 Tax=Acidipila sp. EB88 TaxID=2305226 RepID=UPI000F5E7590|nr:M24 family metallopeptidase [Acidipila sp. EB88]RRA49016.1 M24 family metallopeptidase [Acidipila sp. EB88]
MSEHLKALEQASGGAAARQSELQHKLTRLEQWLQASGYDAVLLRRHENLAWISAGEIQARVGILSETGVLALLLLRDGRRFALAPSNEAPRMQAEELVGLGYELITGPWHAFNVADEATRLGGARVATDAPAASLPVVSLAALRAPLLPAEIARFRELGRHTADAVAHTLLALQPGVSEYEMEAWLAERLLREGIFPSVLLMAVDDRILSYKHAVARGATLQRFGMLNLCTRRWGLVVSITRFVHFGKLPTELARGFQTAALVNAALQHATRNGATAASLFETAAAAYAQAGFPGEEQLHHQGGACGYLEREWVATPGGTQQVRTPEAYAWNPSSRGGKVEDTTLAIADGTHGHIELLTPTPTLPRVHTECEGSSYVSAGVLVHS